MKLFPSLFIMFALLGSSQAGILGLFTSETRDWAFIQTTGGIRIAPPMHKDGKVVLPVIYWPEGNSGLMVRKIKLQQQDRQLAIQVVTQVVEKGSDAAARNFVDLAGITPGSYTVYYETLGDPAKKLGLIVIK